MRSAVVVSLVFFSTIAAAQPCTPRWDPTLGVPGVADGYAGPMFVWDDGGGEDLYIGGSFAVIGGRSSRFLTRYDTAASQFQRLGTGLNQGFTNGYVAALAAFDPGTGEELIVGGLWADAAGVTNSASLARWNGTRWANLDAGWNSITRGSVWRLTPWQGSLYVGGGFAAIGPLAAANGIARWDGETWTSVGTGFGGGFAPNVFAIKPFDDGTGEKLYVAGRFTSIGSVTGMIARWNGANYEPVGDGIFGGTFSSIETAAIFDDGSGPALYVGGADLMIPGFSTCSIARWDGVSWNPVGQYLGGRTTSLTVWDDGSGPALYCGGTAQPGISYLARLESGVWEIYDGGIGGSMLPPGNFPSVFGLTTWRGNLVVAGTFTGVGPGETVTASGLAEHTACLPDLCPADLTGASDPNDPTYGLPDGALDISDFFFYLDQFVAANLDIADLTGSSDPNDPSYGMPDGALDAADFFYYLDLFVAGCD